MRRLRTFTAATALAATAAGLTAWATAADARPATPKSTLQRDLDRVQRSADIPGLLAEFDDRGHDIRARDGVARLGGKEKMPWHGEFRIASTTKTFVSTVALQLVDEGKLSLDDTVEKWLPGLIKGNGNDGSKITVRELLGQTSGLYNYLEDPDLLGDLAKNIDKYRYDATPAEEWVRIAMKHRPEFAPGTQWKYSNTNYVVAAMIIQRVTGQPWDVEVEHRIIAPLNLKHTYSTGANPFIDGPHAHSYTQLPGQDKPYDLTDTSLGHAGDAGLVSTTADLNTFFRALIDGKLLSRKALSEMETTRPADDADFPRGRYGLGLRWMPLSCGGGYWHHEGDHPGGFHTRTGVTADGSRSIVISTTGNPGATTSAALNKLVDDAFCGK
jgi:D-alanyl-D-alanine carboxypeptidase